MPESNRWARESYPDYRNDVNDAIGFSGLGVDYFLKGKADHAIRLLDRYAESGAVGASCLDIGCGIGAMHPALAGRLNRLSGVDVSTDAIDTARLANPWAEYHTSGDGRLPYPDGSFDMTMTVCVMHHVPPSDWAAFVAEAWRVTRPGGLFAVFEHNPLNPLTRLAVMRCPFDHDAVLLRSGKVRQLLQDQGFALLGCDYLFYVPLKSGWAKRLDRALSWLPIGAQYAVCGRKPR
ncbi:class I SAM-dependent methyltransferase [Lysobacter cavernae]|uniref:Class I SAM-dependent methyltransferase n=1 Tax=Lysobacter cavernae TaxID=1685901 RepID=A0ABV7RR69_9GAMM